LQHGETVQHDEEWIVHVASAIRRIAALLLADALLIARGEDLLFGRRGYTPDRVGRLDVDGHRDQRGATAVTRPERTASTSAAWSRSVWCEYASANTATASSNVRRRPR